MEEGHCLAEIAPRIGYSLQQWKGIVYLNMVIGMS